MKIMKIMKTMKLLLLALLLLPITSFAQLSKISSIEFLGIDFSCVNIVGAEENEEQFHEAFEGINGLIHMEPKKYNISKFLRLNINEINTQTARQRINLHNDDYFSKENRKISIDQIIKAYPSKEGNMLLIIATELNKPMGKASFVAVIFNGESKEIYGKQELNGKAGGFGLRNYCAGSFYNSLKKSYRNLESFKK